MILLFVHTIVNYHEFFISSYMVTLINHNCQIEEKDGIVYCRVCGSIIANTSNIIIKEAEERDFSNEVENQESNVHIHYDSFESSVFYDSWYNN